jgi:ribosomal-protein-alanine N-acetyltransferase
MNLETERLIVRQFRPDDWRDLLAYLSLPEVYTFEPGEPIDPVAARALAGERSKSSAFLAVELRAERVVVGHLWFDRVEPASMQTWELGFIFSPGYQRRGYATEATRALMTHAFSAMGVHRVVANCNPDNTASWRVLEKAGFVREARLRRNIFFRRDEAGTPQWQDTFVYGLLADDLGR